MVRTMGLEPMTSTLATSCSTWLNYIRIMTMMFVGLTDDAHRNMERKTGIEPAASSLEDSRSAD